MITTLLIANRGEIARRIQRTCRELGIATVAVHSDADARAPHVTEADAAVRLPGDAPADTYLRADLIIAAALAAGADAVHPGYGFLSENADFARAVAAAGLTWIGPPPEAIETMASKPRAKALMGSPELDPGTLTDEDLPVLVKAAAGGGGRGMRVVRERAALPGELAAASAEARASFGDGQVFLEPYVEGGRHIEVQLLADAHGRVWTLGTRDCSLQRRHQKVIEEAPAPGLGDAQRAALADAAVRAARTVGYRGAGTVEYLLAPDGRAHFLEMNTRLQVEHPVTEEVYGIDLVAWGIALAQGDPLPPQPPAPHGHAVEARLYAEDPARDWLPATGVLHRLHVPGAGRPGLRLDSGIADGDTITAHYDPMLAKVIAWAPTREQALRRLADALHRARIHGPATNRSLLVRALRHPDMRAARPCTGFFDRHPALRTDPEPGARLAALACALADAADRSHRSALTARLGGWRNLPSAPAQARYRHEPDGEEHEIRYHHARGRGPRPEPGDFPGVTVVEAGPGRVLLETGGVRRAFTVARYGQDERHVDSPLGAHALTALPRLSPPRAEREPGSLLAPMPGTVTRIAEGLSVGAAVTAGQALLWLEAMKMEHRVTAPADGILTALHVRPGRHVEPGTPLAVVGKPPQP